MDKIMFWKDVPEIKTWGEGKNGQILFGSGNDTYALNEDKLEKVEPLESTVKNSMAPNDDFLELNKKHAVQYKNFNDIQELLEKY